MTISEPTTSLNAPIGGARIVSWGAIFSGVFIAAALYLALLILGTGLGFAVVSPWNFQDYSSGAIGTSALVWIIVTQIISSGGGGYIAGRLAPDQCNTANQQVRGTHFYHMAHGMVVWALSSIAIALLLGSAASNILSGGSAAVAAVGKGAGMGIGAGTYFVGNSLLLSDKNGSEMHSSGSVDGDGFISYALDSLLRPQSESDNGSEGQRASAANTNRNSDTQNSNAQKKEIARIFISSLQNNEMSDTDKKYVAQLVSERTGMSQAEARKRIDETMEQMHTTLKKAEGQAKEMLDSARTAMAVAALWSFFTLLIGALVAAGAACYGGGWAQRRFARSQK